jgi:hypothetical protein
MRLYGDALAELLSSSRREKQHLLNAEFAEERSAVDAQVAPFDATYS